eukprot:UN04108
MSLLFVLTLFGNEYWLVVYEPTANLSCWDKVLLCGLCDCLLFGLLNFELIKTYRDLAPFVSQWETIALLLNYLL